jgi:hypothetical protein
MGKRHMVMPLRASEKEEDVDQLDWRERENEK